MSLLCWPLLRNRSIGHVGAGATLAWWGALHRHLADCPAGVSPEAEERATFHTATGMVARARQIGTKEIGEPGLPGTGDASAWRPTTGDLRDAGTVAADEHIERVEGRIVRVQEDASFEGETR